MVVDALQHVNIRVRDLAPAQEFYVQVVGLRLGPRPPVASVGCWLYLGDAPVIHLVQVPPGEVPSTGGGAVDHIGFRGIDFAATRRRLEITGIPFREAIVARDGTRQLFVHDPEGIKIELNFDPVPA